MLGGGRFGGGLGGGIGTSLNAPAYAGGDAPASSSLRLMAMASSASFMSDQEIPKELARPSRPSCPCRGWFQPCSLVLELNWQGAPSGIDGTCFDKAAIGPRIKET